MAVAPSPRAASRPQGGLAAAAGGGGLGLGLGPAPSSEYADQLRAVPQLAALGAPFKTCPAVQLTEDETEYKVVCVRHVLPAHDVFQFHVTNTVREQVLEEVGVAMDLSECSPGWAEAAALPLGVAPNEGAGQAYVVLSREEGALPMGLLPCVLRFRVKEIDPGTGEAEEEGYDDEYQLEEVVAGGADYFRPAHPAGGFAAAWDAAGEGGAEEVVDSYALGAHGSLQDAVESVLRALGLAPADGSDLVAPNARSHAAAAAGTAVGDVPVLVRLNFGIDAARNVAMKVAVRADTPEAAEAVHLLVQDGA